MRSASPSAGSSKPTARAASITKRASPCDGAHSRSKASAPLCVTNPKPKPPVTGHTDGGRTNFPSAFRRAGPPSARALCERARAARARAARGGAGTSALRRTGRRELQTRQRHRQSAHPNRPELDRLVELQAEHTAARRQPQRNPLIFGQNLGQLLGQIRPRPDRFGRNAWARRRRHHDQQIVPGETTPRPSPPAAGPPQIREIACVRVGSGVVARKSSRNSQGSAAVLFSGDLEPPNLFALGSALGWVVVVGAAWLLRSRLYAIFRAISLGLQITIIATLFQRFEAVWPAVALPAGRGVRALGRVDPPPAPARLVPGAVQYPRRVLRAGAMFAPPWPLRSYRLPLPWPYLPFVAAPIGVVQSLTAREEERDVVVDGTNIEGIVRAPKHAARVARPPQDRSDHRPSPSDRSMSVERLRRIAAPARCAAIPIWSCSPAIS